MTVNPVNPVNTVTFEVLPSPAPSHQLAIANPVAEINSLHRRATSSAEAAKSKAAEASHYALLAGIRLEQLQASTPHGEWGKLFTDRRNPLLTSNASHIAECEAFEFGQETARRYIEVAKRIRLDRRLSSKAVRHLETIAAAPEIDDAARATLHKLTAGQTLRQLYFDLDILTAPAAKTKPDAAAAPKKLLKTDAQLRIEDAREATALWKEAWLKFLKRGHLDDLPQDEVKALQEFLMICRDAVKARLQPAKAKV